MCLKHLLAEPHRPRFWNAGTIYAGVTLGLMIPVPGLDVIAAGAFGVGGGMLGSWAGERAGDLASSFIFDGGLKKLCPFC